MVITIKDITTSLMVKLKKRSISITELYNCYVDLEESLNSVYKNSLILYGNVYIKDFLRENPEFEFIDSRIFLKNGFDFNYLQEKFISLMSLEKLEIFGLLAEETKEEQELGNNIKNTKSFRETNKKTSKPTSTSYKTNRTVKTKTQHLVASEKER